MTATVAFDHVAIAVPSLRRSLEFYMDVLGARFLYGGENPEIGYRAVILDLPGGRTELMEPMGDVGSFPDFLRRTGGGLHHVTYRTEDFEATIARVRGAGYELTGLADGASLKRKQVFVRPRDLDGTLVQIVWEAADANTLLNDGLESVLAGAASAPDHPASGLTGGGTQ